MCGQNTVISSDGMWLADVYPGITKEAIHVYDNRPKVSTDNNFDPLSAIKIDPPGCLICVLIDNSLLPAEFRQCLDEITPELGE